MNIIKISTKTQKLTKKELNLITKTLQNGGLIVYPTETAYGIGALATSKHGVTKLLAYKSRPTGKAISIATTGQKMASKYVVLNNVAKNFYKNFLPGPFTVISKSRGVVDKRLESEKGTLGIRVPDHPIIQQILKKLNQPITSTSANVSGKKTPYSLKDIFDNISKKRAKFIDLALDYGTLPKRPTSVVIDTTVEIPEIIRGQSDQITGLNMQNKFLLDEFEVNNLDDLKVVAKKLLLHLKKSREQFSLVFLSGNMGAGKTYLVKEVANLLNIKSRVISPTFVLERRYNITGSEFKELVHYDLWRLDVKNTLNKDVLSSIGFWESIKSRNLVFVEWPEKINGFFEKLKQKGLKNLIFVEIEAISEDKRIFKLFRVSL